MTIINQWLLMKLFSVSWYYSVCMKWFIFRVKDYVMPIQLILQEQEMFPTRWETVVTHRRPLPWNNRKRFWFIVLAKVKGQCIQKPRTEVPNYLSFLTFNILTFLKHDDVNWTYLQLFLSPVISWLAYWSAHISTVL